jgi:DUF1365 family protein
VSPRHEHATSALYVGHVVHARRSPAHSFRAPMYFHLFDLTELAPLERRVHLFGYNRSRPVSLWDKDHLGKPGRSIAENVRCFLEDQGGVTDVDRVLLLTQCRVLGYVFNPVSFYYCLNAAGALTAVVAEVHNTYGELHSYLLRASGESVDGQFRGEEKKVFHVSPFMTLDGTYRYAFSPPLDSIEAHLALATGGLNTFVAHLRLRRKPITDRALLGAMMRYPLMPQRVIGSIHWQGLKLWRRGARFHSKPPYAPAAAASGTRR